MNLNHTVAIVCYEWFQTLLPKIGREKSLPKTVHAERLPNPDLKRELIGVQKNFLVSAKEDQKVSAADTLGRVILRGMPTDDEVHRLLGLLSAAIEAILMT